MKKHIQGGPHNHAIAGIAVAMKHAATPEFKDYQTNVVNNAKVNKIFKLFYTTIKSMQFYDRVDFKVLQYLGLRIFLVKPLFCKPYNMHILKLFNPCFKLQLAWFDSLCLVHLFALKNLNISDKNSNNKEFYQVTYFPIFFSLK